MIILNSIAMQQIIEITELSFVVCLFMRKQKNVWMQTPDNNLLEFLKLD